MLLGDILQPGRDGGVPLVKDVHVRLEHADVRAHLNVADTRVNTHVAGGGVAGGLADSQLTWACDSP